MQNKEFEAIRIPRANDKRVKISSETRARIKELHAQGLSQRQIAGKTGASRRSVIFILYPERRLANVAARNARIKALGFNPYETTEKRRNYMRAHRAHKRAMLGLPPTKTDKAIMEARHLGTSDNIGASS